MHIPVLKKEVLEYLNPKSNENFIDGTIGQGSHARAILEKTGPEGKVLGIDRDPEMIKNLEFQVFPLRGISRRETSFKFQDRLILVNDSYSNLKEIIKKNNFKSNGILLDLGLSSWQIENSGRGFSFMKDEPLDMRYNRAAGLTAEEIINKWPEEKIASILKEYGEERFSGKIAGRIVEERRTNSIKTTFQLVALIKKSIPKRFQRGQIHCATRTFQALRIAVNDELNNLKKVLPQTVDILEGGGRLVIISFHSLEDRIVKVFFKENSQFLKILTKKPITPSFEEIKLNQRSRSAKLRAAIKN